MLQPLIPLSQHPLYIINHSIVFEQAIDIEVGKLAVGYGEHNAFVLFVPHFTPSLPLVRKQGGGVKHFPIAVSHCRCSYMCKDMAYSGTFVIQGSSL